MRALRCAPIFRTSALRCALSTSTAEFPEDEGSIIPKQLNDVLPEDALSPPPAGAIDWSRSFHGLSATPFSSEIAQTLMGELDADSIEIKPDGLLYLPEIKYRRILNQAFGPGGWGLAPRGETLVTEKSVSREYALICHGRLVSVARGEQDYFGPEGIATATEGCKSNALMRCCKDLGVASELWDPSFIRAFKRDNCVEQFVEHVVSKKRRKLCEYLHLYTDSSRLIFEGRRKDTPFDYPYKVTTFN